MSARINRHIITPDRRGFIKLMIGVGITAATVVITGRVRVAATRVDMAGYGSAGYGTGRYGMPPDRYAVYLAMIKKK